MKTLLQLLLCNLVWSMHPLMGKWVLADFTFAEGAWLRYSGALCAYVVFLVVYKTLFRKTALPGDLGRSVNLKIPGFVTPSDGSKDFLGVILLGFLTFCLSPLLQLTGLSASRATDNALIIAMEPLMTVALAWIFLKQRLTQLQWLAFLAALTGFCLLSGISLDRMLLKESFDSHFFGNLILVVSLVGEASYTVLGRKLLSKYPGAGIFGSALAVGVFFLTASVLVISPGGLAMHSASLVSKLTVRSFVALLWLGPLGTTASYLFWISALRDMDVAVMALTLFVQPVFGYVWGAVFLAEHFNTLQSIGALFILAAVFVQILPELKRARPSRAH